MDPVVATRYRHIWAFNPRIRPGNKRADVTTQKAIAQTILPGFEKLTVNLIRDNVCNDHPIFHEQF